MQLGLPLGCLQITAPVLDRTYETLLWPSEPSKLLLSS